MGMAIFQQNFIYKKQTVGRIWPRGPSLLTPVLNPGKSADTISKMPGHVAPPPRCGVPEAAVRPVQLLSTLGRGESPQWVPNFREAPEEAAQAPALGPVPSLAF